jgi:hypothetical protein
LPNIRADLRSFAVQLRKWLIKSGRIPRYIFYQIQQFKKLFRADVIGGENKVLVLTTVFS